MPKKRPQRKKIVVEKRKHLEVVPSDKPACDFKIDDVDELVSTMAARFVPENAVGLDETTEFRLSGRVFHTVVKDGTIEVNEGPAENPDLVMSAIAEKFLAISNGDAQGAIAFLSGAVRLDGDKMVAVRFNKYLPPYRNNKA